MKKNYKQIIYVPPLTYMPPWQPRTPRNAVLPARNSESDPAATQGGAAHDYGARRGTGGKAVSRQKVGLHVRQVSALSVFGLHGAP